MSRVISFRDLQVIPELSHYNEIELLHPMMDETVNKYLEKLGFNTSAPIEYIPNKHRDMRGNVAVGFRAVGTIDTFNTAFLRSGVATMEDRIMATFFTDPSLARELAQMLNTGIDFGTGTDELLDEEDEFPEEWIEPDFEDVADELKRMEELRDSIRGPMHNEAGAPKTTAEYRAYYDAATGA